MKDENRKAIETLQEVTGIIGMFATVINMDNSLKDKMPIDLADLTVRMAKAADISINAIKLVDDDLEIES